jgi:hypothetical protein
MRRFVAVISLVFVLFSAFTSTARLTAVESYPDPDMVAAILEANAVKAAPNADEAPTKKNRSR